MFLSPLFMSLGVSYVIHLDDLPYFLGILWPLNYFIHIIHSTNSDLVQLSLCVCGFCTKYVESFSLSSFPRQYTAASIYRALTTLHQVCEFLITLSH
jgi:hypothetical protein